MKTRPFVSLFALCGVVAQVAMGADPATPRSTLTPQVVVLDPYEANYTVLSRGHFVTSQSAPFKKEPTGHKGAVVRGLLPLGGDATNTMDLLWLKQEARLHLDLNRNHDLTDDPAGVYSASGKGDFQIFRDVRLPLKTDSGVHTFKLELTFNHYGNSLFANIQLQSYWRGKTSWQGQEVELAVVEAPWGYGSGQGPFLVLRPWERRDQRIDLVNGTADAIDLPKQVFWRDLAYRLNRSFEKKGETELCRLELTEEKPALGDLSITGSFLNRIILVNDSGYTAVLDDPAGKAKVPLGTYRLDEVWVKKDGAQAVQSSQRTLNVNAKAPASLVAGGPLTNSFSVKRRGKNLVLDYRLLGVDGGTYRFLHDGRQEPPTVTIAHNGKTVASGQFRYG